MRLLREWMQKLRSLFIRHKPTGYFPDKPDSRDYRITGVGEIDVLEIPSFKDYGYNPYQGRNQSCVGYTLARLLQVIIWQETGVYRRPSEHFIWFNAKEEAGWAFENKGVYPRDAIKRLFKDGYVPRYMLPNNPKYDYEPQIYHYAVAEMVGDLLLERNYKYYRVGKTDAIKMSDSGRPVAVSLPVSNGMVTTRDGFVYDDKDTHYFHYMSLEGSFVKDGVTWLRFMNWWGKGYLYIKKEYFMKHARDLWVITNKQ